jgi:hypothetical protein
MADFGSPVAAGVQGPQSGLQTLAGLLSLKQQGLSIQQQQLGLQQQSQTLKSQTAAATMATIDAQQKQAVSKVNWQSFTRPDGSYDTDGATAKMLEVAPNHPEWAERLSQTGTAGAQAKQAFFNLSQQYQEPVRAAFGTWAADPNAKPSDLAAQLQAISENAPKSEQGNLDKIIKNTFGVMTGPDVFTGQPKTLQQQKGAALAYARAGLSPSETAGAGGVATAQPTALSTGGAIIPGSVAPPASGQAGAFTPQGKPVPTTLAPTLVTPHPGAAPPVVVGGAAGVPGAAPTAKSGSAPGGMPNWWTDAANNAQLNQAKVAALGARVAAGNQAANSSPAAIDALSRARALMGTTGTATGTGFPAIKDLRNTLASMGVDTAGAQDASELAKNLARYEAARAGSVGDTDAARSLYEAGAPNTKMDSGAVKAVIMQSLGIEKMIQGYAKVVGGATTAQGAMQAEQKFRSIPNLVQAYELGFMRNQGEADEFMKRYGISGKEIAKSAQQLQQMGAM